MNPYLELKYAAPLMHAGFNPFWNPYLSCGTPLFAQPGLALAYPGTLLALLVPAPLGEAFFLLLHGALAFCGARQLARRQSLRMAPDLAATAYALAALTLGFVLAPSYLAGLAWLPWVFLAGESLERIACMALLLSSMDLVSIFLALGGMFFLSAQDRRRYALSFIAAFGLSAAATLPSLEALVLTHPSSGKILPLASEEAQSLEREMRGDRVMPESLSLTASGDSAIGPLWATGSRRPVWSFSFAQRLLPTDEIAKNLELNLWGVSGLLSRDASGLKNARLNAPVRAAMVSAARVKDNGTQTLVLESTPFINRPLLLDDDAAGADSQAVGAVWTMLAPSFDAMGESAVSLPKVSKGSWLYLSDTLYPGWMALVNGKERPIFRAEGSFRALEIGPGDQNVQFLYRPNLFYIGLFLAFASLALLWHREISSQSLH